MDMWWIFEECKEEFFSCIIFQYDSYEVHGYCGIMLISLLINFQRLVKDAVDAGDNTEEEAKKKKKAYRFFWKSCAC